MFRGYDMGLVLREDMIERVRQGYKEIEQLQKDIERQKQEAVAANERLERLMKEMGLTEPPKTGNDNQW